MKNRRGGGNFRDKRVTFQFRIFRIPEIFSSLMKNFFRRVKDLARSIYLFRIFPLPSPSESHRSCSILFHHRGRTVCLDTLPNNTLLIIATIIPWTITKCSVVTLCIREVQRMSCVTKNLCNVTRLNLIKLGGFGCENWMGNFGLINFPLYLRSYLKRSPLVHQYISFHPENYPSIPLVNLSFRFPRARFQTLFRKISNHRLLLLNQLQKLERIPSDFHAIRLSSSCSPLDPSVDTPDGRE